MFWSVAKYFEVAQISYENMFFSPQDIIGWEPLLMQEKVSCVLIGLLALVFAWELQEDLLISMRSQGQGLYIEM